MSRPQNPFASLFGRHAKASRGKGVKDDNTTIEDEDDLEEEEAKKARKKAKKAEEDDSDKQDEEDEADPKASAARARERARVEAILTHPSAHANPTGAIHLAISTNVSRRAAVAALDALAGRAPSAPESRRDDLRERMAHVPNPPIGAEDQRPAPNLAAQIIAAGKMRRGERFFGAAPKPSEEPRTRMTPEAIIRAAALGRGEKPPAEIFRGPEQNALVVTGEEINAVIEKRRRGEI